MLNIPFDSPLGPTGTTGCEGERGPPGSEGQDGNNGATGDAGPAGEMEAEFGGYHADRPYLVEIFSDLRPSWRPW